MSTRKIACKNDVVSQRRWYSGFAGTVFEFIGFASIIFEVVVGRFFKLIGTFSSHFTQNAFDTRSNPDVVKF